MSSKRSRAVFESTANGSPPAHATYALYGTPLPVYDPSARDDGSYVPLWKQEATDEQGRKRFHGAFTGGYSAGYYNTVGSKEGWAPASFVSSRSKRQKDGQKVNQPQRVEDFMDEEDLAQRAEGEKLEMVGQFAGLGNTSAGDGGGKGMFGEIFRVQGETMGVKLLQRMGWRHGQGVGPKVMRRVKGDDKGEMHLFAPENSRMIRFNRKIDRKGIGFAGEEILDGQNAGGDDQDDESDRDARILQVDRSKGLAKPKKLKKSGLGVGVLNDTGSDDENAYDIGPKINYNRVLGGDKKPKKAATTTTNTATTDVQKPASTSKKLSQRTTALTGFRKCHDGRLPIDGFILSLATLSIQPENKYPPIPIPSGWQPSRTIPPPDSKETTYQSTADAAKASTLNPKTRANILGETPLPSKSVFDFMTPAARERLAQASGRTNLPPALSEKPTEHAASETRNTIPHISRAAAESALHRITAAGNGNAWIPYAEDPSKRERYIAFLETSAQGTIPERAKGFSAEVWMNEMREFVQVALRSKPVSGLMGLRFTSSSSSSSSTTVVSTSEMSAGAKGVLNTGIKGKEDDPAEKAAKLGMYGAMTRSRQPFYPSRLLCKRFNVRVPASVAGDTGGGGGGDASVDESKRLDVVSQASLDQMMREGGFGGGFVSGGVEGGEEGFEGRREGVGVVDSERNEALEGPRAGDEVFRAVFGAEDVG